MQINTATSSNTVAGRQERF